MIRIFIEDFQSSKSLGLEHQKHIYTCLYQSASFIIAPTLGALRSLSPATLSTSLSAIKLLGSLLSIYSLDLDELPQCIQIVLTYITQPSPETVELVTACVEAITEVVSFYIMSSSDVQLERRVIIFCVSSKVSYCTDTQHMIKA